MSNPKASNDSSAALTPMRRVLGNLGFLLGGRGFAALMMLGATTLMARTLGAGEFGVLVLIQTYAFFLHGVLNFQLFEAIVRYGVPLHDSKDSRALQRLLHICWRLDLRASVIATLLALVLAPLVGSLLDMNSNHILLMAGYSLTLLATTGNSTATGVLRLFDRFDTLGRQMTIGPVIRFIGVVVAWWTDATMTVFVVIYALAAVAEGLYMNWRGWKEYQQQIGFDYAADGASMDDFSGLRPFIWITYWQANIDLAYKSLSILLAGYLLGSVEAGLLSLARQFASFLYKPSVLIRQVVFLDQTRSWNQGTSDFKLLTYRTAFYAIGFGLVFVIAGYYFAEPLLVNLVGEEFGIAAPLLTLLLLAATFDLGAASLRSAAYVVGRAGRLLAINAATTVIYVLLFLGLIPVVGLAGAGLAACVAGFLPLLAMVFMINRILQQESGATAG